MTTEYVSGECNIGTQEVARRRNLGWVSLALTIVVVLILVWTKVNPWWRLFVFFPATLSASGFLQAWFRFCSGFARIGGYNFGPIGQIEKIVDEESKKKDRRKGNQITLYAATIGAVVAVLCMFMI